MNYAHLSREVAYVLRHAPWEYELELDEHGWVSLKQLVNSLNESSAYQNVTEYVILQMIEAAKKKRFEISNNRIRAFYGHSVPNKIVVEQSKPPEFLYHGTSRKFLDSIRMDGLKPNGRQYVHLSQDTETAETVGKRKDIAPVILVVRALKAWNAGVYFYHGNEMVWLADAIPAEYIEIFA